MVISIYLSLNPFFINGTSFARMDAPSSAMFAPQFLPMETTFEAYIAREYEFLNRFGLGISRSGIGLFWYSINVEEEFLNAFFLGMNFGEFAVSVGYADVLEAGVGFKRKFQYLDVCAYAGLYGDRLGYGCVFSDYGSGIAGVELMVQEGYPIDYRFYGDYETDYDIRLFVSYETLSRSFRIGLSYRFFTIAYGENRYLGPSYYYGMRLRRK